MALNQEVVKMKNNNNNKWTDNIWFVRIISLFFAIFLYAFVASENNRFDIQPSNASINVTETISNVPVQLGPVDDDVFVSNLQENVSLRVTGPQNIVTQVLAQDLYVVTEDLRGSEMGQQQVRLEMPSDLEESGVEYQITPSRVIVDLDRLASTEVDIQYEIEDGVVAEGYEIGNVSMEPATVVLTGKESTIEKIDRASVKISSDEPVTETFTRDIPIEIRDSANNLLDLNANITNTRVTVEVRQIADPVANISLNITGENPENYNYEYALVGSDQVTLEGDASIINNINQVTATLDVSGITTSGTFPATIQIPDGVSSVAPQTIDVSVTITPVETNSPVEPPEESEEPVLPDASEGTPSEVSSETTQGSIDESVVTEEQVD